MKPYSSILAHIHVYSITPIHPFSPQVSTQHPDWPRGIVKSCPIVYLKHLFFVLCLSFEIVSSQGLEYGTTVVYVRTKDSVIIGAESKVLFGRGIGLDATSFNLEKIRICGNMAYAMAGVCADTNTGYDAFKIAESSCRGDSDLWKKARTFRSMVRPALEFAWNGVIKRNPLVDLDTYDLVFIGASIVKDIPSVVVMEIHAENPKPPHFDSMRHKAIGKFVGLPSPAYTDSTYHQVFSPTINDDSLEDIAYLIKANPIEYVRESIQRAIDIDPTINGKPIRILCITRKEMRWIQ
jgi:hypothetical protein